MTIDLIERITRRRSTVWRRSATGMQFFLRCCTTPRRRCRRRPIRSANQTFSTFVNRDIIYTYIYKLYYGCNNIIVTADFTLHVDGYEFKNDRRQ